MRGLLCRLKQWWQDMSVPHHYPEMDSMRKEIRKAVHHNRNLAFEAMAESRRARKVSNAATQSAHDAIRRLEEAKKGGNDGAPLPLGQ